MSHYHRMSIAEKQAVSIETQREAYVSCPGCDTKTPPADLLAHVAQRCPGRREPGPRSIWVSWRDAIAAGLPDATLVRWVRRGEVRVRGPRQDRQYLLRDLALRLAQRRVHRR